MSLFRDRIVEVRKCKASELTDHENNWRMHPEAQREGLTGLLGEVGKVDTLKAYYSERAGGRLVLLDGHLRKAIEPDEEWNVTILDINDAEADKLLLLFDPITAMAEMNAQKVLELTDRVNTDDLAVRELLRRMELDAQHVAEDEDDEEEKKDKEKTGPPAMELMPFEHYDYVLLMFKNELDWIAAVDVLGLEKRADQRKTHKIGLARVIDGKRVIERLQKAEFAAAQAKSAQRTPEVQSADRHPEPQAV